MYLSDNKDKDKERNRDVARMQWDSWIQDSTEESVEYDSGDESIENEES